ncbi:MAG: DNA polymerase III subunit gamma/tau [Firmicutes bacterium]|nr:DNA polymerase III subunit gamma/tau [Bacillota bacterium]
MAYISLYRKWRPQRFSDVIGQTHVTRTLQNALQMGRIGHAYLFSGPRGTGKTTIAKLFAKAVNCAKGPGPEPCDECENCLQIKQGVSMDVIEIDGASNRGIDEIRDLREKVRFVPSQGRYKVYIIDEVHMLTTEAFNALLKTLEEPPSHAIFIFATTEPHKVPATILSRCQSFSFHRIALTDLVARLRQIAEAESLEVSDSALHLIARNAQGGLRDALSLLDQCIAFADSAISVEDVKALLGVVEFDLVADFTAALLARNLVRALEDIEQVVVLGKDLTQFATAVLEYWRDLMVYKAGGGSPEDYTDAELAKLVEQAKSADLAELTGMVALLGETLPEVRRYQTKLPLELVALKVVTRQGLPEQAQSADFPRPVVNNPVEAQPVTQPEPVRKEKPATKPEPPVSEEPVASEGQASSALQRWPEFLAYLKTRQLLKLQALLRDATPKLDGQKLWVVFRPEMTFHRDNINLAGNREELEAAAAEFFRTRWQIEAVCGEVPSMEPTDNSKKISNWEQDPLVQRAINMFGASIVKIEEK